jgi:Glycosyltransferase family 87
MAGDRRLAPVPGSVVRTVLGATAALAIAVAAIAYGPTWAAHSDPAVGVAAIGLAWAAFAVGAWCVLRLPARWAVPLILAGGLALQLAAAGGPPRSSDDLYRYVWDGRVQAAGIDPYRYAPAAPELAGLRDPFLWPDHANWCITQSTVDQLAGCTVINRPTVHTIYPPVAEAAFAAVYPFGSGYGPVRVLAILAVLAITLLLLIGLHRTGLDARRAVLWAWCPTVALEAASNAHIDVVAALLTGAALLVLASTRRRTSAALGGVLLGLGIATKLTPVLVLPSVVRRRPVTVLLGVVGAVAVVYLPHILAVGAGVLGYLPGYLQEEGYDSGTRFALLTAVVPETWAAPLAVLILAAVAVHVARTTDPRRPWDSAATMTGAALLVTTPSYPWYALLLVFLVALGGRAMWLAVGAAAYVGQYQNELRLGHPAAERTGYGVAIAVMVAAWLWQLRTSTHTADAATARPPESDPVAGPTNGGRSA